MNFSISFLTLLLPFTRAITPSLSGCGISHDPYEDGVSRNFSITSNNVSRSYNIHLPANYDPNTSYPLMISYHGGKQTAKDQESTSQFSNNSVNPDMIAVYPQGIKNTWQNAPFANHSISDTLFTIDLLNNLTANYCISPTQIFCSGKSDGGGFCDVLACDNSTANLFSAFAPVAGAFYTDLNSSSICNPGRSTIPILEFHSVDDCEIFYEGGESASHGELPSIPDWLERWAVRNRCEAGEGKVETEHRDASGGLEYTTVTYSCGGVEDVVSHYKSERKICGGKDHIWPTLENSWIEASPLILDFCRRNSRGAGDGEADDREL